LPAKQASSATVDMLARLKELEREAARLRRSLKQSGADADADAEDLPGPPGEKLGHRFKNTLVLIQATAWQTGLGAVDVPDFLKLFDGRLRAIGAACDVLTRSGWGSFPLADLVQAVLADHDQAARERVKIAIAAGLPPLLPDAAHNLALAFHELIVNAVEHGALSTPAGTVELDARLEGGELVLTWQERGGPPVAPPMTQGFGTALLDRVVARRYAGRAELDWQPAGLVCTLRMPAARILDQTARPARKRGA
jgi:two-component sensor histidine kinase